MSSFRLQVPTASTVPDLQSALNRCKWHGSGTHLAVGGTNGKIYLYDVAEVSTTPYVGIRVYLGWSPAITLHGIMSVAMERFSRLLIN